MYAFYESLKFCIAGKSLPCQRNTRCDPTTGSDFDHGEYVTIEIKGISDLRSYLLIGGDVLVRDIQSCHLISKV